MIKFSPQMDKDVLLQLRKHALENGQTLSSLLDIVVREYLDRVRVRPMFNDIAEQVMDENEELLRALAQ